MKRKSYAKVNIALNVLNKSKPKELHDLDMVNVVISLYDRLVVNFIDDDKNEIIISSNNIHVPLDNQNIVYKVVEKYKKIFKKNFSCSIYIEKNIPLEAGLAGGSSNGAKMLEILDKHFKSKMTALQKMSFIEEITSDGPFMVLNTPCRVKGNGNKVTPIKAKIKGKMLVIKPFTGCNTKQVYQNLDYKTLSHPNINKVELALCENNYELLAKHIGNSMLDSACQLNSDISEILEKLKKCGFEIVSMSGSGSTCFAMSKNNKAFNMAKSKLNPGDYDLYKVCNIKINKKIY